VTHARRFVVAGLGAVAVAAACTSFSSSDAPNGADAGGDADGDAASDGGADVAQPDPCDLADAALPRTTGCGNTQISDSNCGVCGHSCGTSTPCTNGLCAQETSPPAGASLAFAGLVDGWVYAAGGNNIVRAHADMTGTAETLASFGSQAMGPVRADVHGLYGALQNTFVFSALHDGGAFTVAASEVLTVRSVAASDDTLFWTRNDAYVAYAPRDGGIEASAAPYINEQTGLATDVVVDGAELFSLNNPSFGDPDGGDGGDGLLYVKELDGGNGAMSLPLGSPRAVTIYGAYVYYFDSWSRTVRRVPRGAVDSPPVLVATLPDAQRYAYAMAADDTDIYILVATMFYGQDAQIFKASRCVRGDGASAPPRVVAIVPTASGLAVDDRYIYTAYDTMFMRVTK
jgi:hypothetical protein